MNMQRNRLNDIDRLCVRDLDNGTPTAGTHHCEGPSGGWDLNWEQGQGAIRTEADPK
jgi:hypothetical protein